MPSDREEAKTAPVTAVLGTGLADTQPAPGGPTSREPVDLPTAPLDLPDGERYEPVSLLGRGGMGEVHAVRDSLIGREVAWKVIRREHTRLAEAVTRFSREARVQGQLEHPAVVPVYDLGTTSEGDIFFTMKRISGSTLADVLEAEEPAWTLHRLLSAFLQVCQCVEYAHVRGVIHRDLKPSNIMLGRFGEVYVLDWGIAKLLGAGAEPVAASDAVASSTRAGLGTPGFMAPEQLEGEVDPRSDVYALGAVLYQIVAGRPLHGGDSLDEVLESTRRGAAVVAVDAAPELVAVSHGNGGSPGRPSCHRARPSRRGGALPRG